MPPSVAALTRAQAQHQGVGTLRTPQGREGATFRPQQWRRQCRQAHGSMRRVSGCTRPAKERGSLAVSWLLSCGWSHAVCSHASPQASNNSAASADSQQHA